MCKGGQLACSNEILNRMGQYSRVMDTVDNITKECLSNCEDQTNDLFVTGEMSSHRSASVKMATQQSSDSRKFKLETRPEQEWSRLVRQTHRVFQGFSKLLKEGVT